MLGFCICRHQSSSQRRLTNTRASTSSSAASRDEPDLSRGSSLDLNSLLDRLQTDLGSIALMSGRELEILSEFEPDELGPEYDTIFLRQIQEAADRHLMEKREIRDALGLLKIYHQSSNAEAAPDAKRKRGGHKK